VLETDDLCTIIEVVDQADEVTLQVLEAVKKFDNFDFLGKRLGDDIAYNLAMGYIHPITKKPLPEKMRTEIPILQAIDNNGNS